MESHSRFSLGKENRHPLTSEIIDPDPDRKFAYVFLVRLCSRLFHSEKKPLIYLEK